MSAFPVHNLLTYFTHLLEFVKSSPSHELRQAYFSREERTLDPYNDFTPSQISEYMASSSIKYSPSELNLIKKSFLSFSTK